jgi:glycosyltransferase involved in cell wall biosynthesis
MSTSRGHVRTTTDVIGVLTTSYPRSADDGSGVFVRERVRALRAEGYLVEILAAGARDGGGCEDGSVTRIPAGGLFYEGGAPEALESPDLLQKLLALGQGARFSLTMLRHLAEQGRRWDAVESHWLVPCGLLACAALPRLPHRAHVHGGDLFLLARLPWGDSLARILCRHRPALVFASASLRDGFSALIGCAPEALGAQCRVEPAPFDASVFRRRSDEDRRHLRVTLGLHSPTVLAAGRLVPIKGFDVLVEAVGQIPLPARPALVIAGDGPERSRLAGLAREALVPLQLTGLLGQRALADCMNAADLFVHPCRALGNGRSEGSPLVVREALACGLPVIASASGGLGELFGARGLTLVDADDADTLARAIVHALPTGQHEPGSA